MTQMTKEEMAAHLAAVPASQEERFVCPVDTDVEHADCKLCSRALQVQ